MTTVIFHKVVRVNTGSERARISSCEFSKAERKAFSHLLDLVEAGNLPEAVEFRRSWEGDPKKKGWGEYLGTDIHDLIWSAAVYGEELHYVKTEKSKEYQVQRNGVAYGEFRRIAGAPSIEAAKKRFEKERVKVRQGELRIVAPEGDVVAYYSSPRLRSKW